jgi:CRISPR-associated exonuclease Cas4
MVNITGTLVWYYYVCHRQVWLIAHQIEPAQDNPYLEWGRIIHETAYPTERKEVKMENIVFDVLTRKRESVVVAEIKKSSKFLKPATMQLCFYLFRLKEVGISAIGELRFPKERKRRTVELTKEIEDEIREALKGITEICLREVPPAPKKIPYCRKCAYRELCWS